MPGALLGGSDLSLADRIESQLQSLSEHRRLGHSLVEQAEPLDALELPLDAPANHVAPATQRTPSGQRSRLSLVLSLVLEVDDGAVGKAARHAVRHDGQLDALAACRAYELGQRLWQRRQVPLGR